MSESLRILIVDDDPISVSILENFIAEEGHSVCAVATDSAEALHAVATLAPDVVFMDIYLKDGASGLKLARTITQKEQLPVIIISGTSDAEVLNQISGSGALSFIQKPVRFIALQMDLRIVMRTHSLQKQLKKSEQQHRLIFNNAAVGIYVSHPDGHYLTCNQAFATMLGYDDPQELLSKLFSQDEQLYDDARRRQEILTLLQEKGGALRMQSKIFGRDGDMLWISEHCTPVFDDQGRLIEYEGVVVDITARKLAEEAFKTTYNLVRSTIDSLLDGILVTDLQGHLVMANAAAMEMTQQYLEEGQKPAYLLEQDATGLFASFLKHLTPQASLVRLCPGKPPVPCDIIPYRNAEDAIIGAVHVFRCQSDYYRPVGEL